jgi:hypothetical protein
MKKEKSFNYSRFAPEVLDEALRTLIKVTENKQEKPTLSILSADFPKEKWTYE